MKRLALLYLLVMAPHAARAELQVFACEPEWAALAEEIGGGLVSAYSATNAFQDPHYIQARPSLIARVRRADLVICSGAQLEIGWLPALLNKANNPAVLPGNPGHIVASAHVERLDVPASVDRSQGDIHPEGNPHVHTDPRNIGPIAEVLAARMLQLDGANAGAYRAGLADFQARWDAAVGVWEQRAAPLRGRTLISHHKSWPYLEAWLGLDEVANLEAVPGIPPTISHLSNLASRFAKGGADYIIRAPYQDDKPSEWLSERSGIPAILLPLTVGGTDRARDLFGLFDDIVDRLLEVQP